MSAIATMPMTPAKPSDSVATAGIVNAGRRARDRRMWRMSKVNTRGTIAIRPGRSGYQSARGPQQIALRWATQPPTNGGRVGFRGVMRH